MKSTHFMLKAYSFILGGFLFFIGFQIILQVVIFTDAQVVSGQSAWYVFSPFFSLIEIPGRLLNNLGQNHALVTAFYLTVTILILWIFFYWSQGTDFATWRVKIFVPMALICGLWSQFLTFTPGYTEWLAWLFVFATFIASALIVWPENKETNETGKGWILCFLVIILFLSFMFRLYKIDKLPPGQAQHTAEWGMTGARLAVNYPVDLLNTESRSMFFREAYVKFAVEPHQIGGNIFFDWVLASVYRPSFIAQRTVPAILGVLSVLLIFLTARLLCNTTTALIAALFAAVSPWHVMHSRYSSPEHILAILFTTLTAYFAFSFFKNRSLTVLTGLIIVLVIDFYIYVTAQVLVPVIFLFWIWSIIVQKKKNRLVLCGSLILTLILVSAGIAPKIGIFGFKEDVKLLNTQISEHPSYEIQEKKLIVANTFSLMKRLFMDGNGAAWFSKRSGYLLWPVSIGLIMGCGICLVRLKRIENVFLLFWLLAGLLPTIPASVVAPRRILCALPVIFILSGKGFDWVIGIRKRNRFMYFVIVLATVLFISGAWNAFTLHSVCLEARRNGPERRLAEIVCSYLPEYTVIVMSEKHTRLEKIWLHCQGLNPEKPSPFAVEFFPEIEMLKQRSVALQDRYKAGKPLIFLMYCDDRGDRQISEIRMLFPDGRDIEWGFDMNFKDHEAGTILFRGWILKKDI
ncbi:glycosyltransferase family 39 protein [bacterium]|nr:glycosyltransferase family 39 protein [bacterium]